VSSTSCRLRTDWRGAGFGRAGCRTQRRSTAARGSANRSAAAYGLCAKATHSRGIMCKWTKMLAAGCFACAQVSFRKRNNCTRHRPTASPFTPAAYFLQSTLADNDCLWGFTKLRADGARIGSGERCCLCVLEQDYFGGQLCVVDACTWEA
jgi:hypothetical protein